MGIAAKMSVVPVRRGYWGSTIGLPHTVPCKLTGKCGSVRVRLIPAPRGTGLVAAPVPKKLLGMAGVEDCYTSARGHTRTPDLWAETFFVKSPLQLNSEFLKQAPEDKKAD